TEEQLISEFPNLRGRTTGEHQAFVAVPLSLEGRTFGAIGLSFHAPRTFSDEDREFLLALGRHCAQALDRARLYEAERHAREDAERANRAKDDFLATLSHEMRTPLTSALGWARMLERDELDSETQRHAVSAIYRSTRSQVRIVEDLLDVSRIIAGKMTVRREPLDLAIVVEDASDLLRSSADERGVRLEADLQPLIVQGDVERLRQVFWNLLSNAIKFSSENGVVRVSMRRSENDAEVEIADTGRGIDPQFIPHLFERFRQADSSTTRSFGGLGLGLSIVHHLVQLHGGSIVGSSEGSGRGAVFVVRLPILKGEVVESSDSRSPATLDLHGLEILVVEDELDSRTMVEMILRRAGATVRSAAAPGEARRLLDEFPAHLIISDVAMPEEDGLTFVRSLRESGNRTPVLALTAYGRGGDEHDFQAAGFDDFLRKPVDPDVLLSTLGRLLRR
ncbi:MAG: response regulator, partial [Acidobacteria bacterium]|nr:response regulator [Acidobacteriota bacterium]